MTDRTAGPVNEPKNMTPPAPSKPAKHETFRWPARAGAFYPADAGAMQREIESYFTQAGLGSVEKKSARAVMLPHAGWRYCGATMAKTLAGVTLPKTVIVIGPKHTPFGPEASVASHHKWQIPGAVIPVDAALAQRLAQNSGLPYETQAHRQEHGTEVLLPMLLRLQPELRFVAIALGRSRYENTAPLARELAAVIRGAQAANQEPPLLVISSDMNHYAAEPENRRRDMLALEAMQSGDPRKLFDICTQEQISMCGLFPAITVMQALRELTPSMAPKLIDYTNSAAASGDPSRVVGYAGVVIE